MLFLLLIGLLGERVEDVIERALCLRDPSDYPLHGGAGDSLLLFLSGVLTMAEQLLHLKGRLDEVAL